MMMMLLTATSLGIAASLPKFADSFYVGVQSRTVVNQNGYTMENGVCCAGGVSGCKIQTVTGGYDAREQVTKERTRMDSPRGSVVTWYGSVRKQMAVVPGSAVNSTRKWACVAYCPVSGDFYPTLTIGQPNGTSKVHDLGRTTITQPASIGGVTKQCERFKWVDRLAVIPMSQTDFCVDQAADQPAPWYKQLIAEPFGQRQWTESDYFVEYAPGQNLSEFFDLDLDPKTCTLSDKCQQADDAPERSALTAADRFSHRSMYDAARALAHDAKTSRLVETADDDPPPPPNISWGGDFVAGETMINLMNQGGRDGLGKGKGDICCTYDEPRCEVQLMTTQGVRYYDLTHQRSRFEDTLTGSIIIDDYARHMAYTVATDGGNETCNEYCPIDPADKMRPFDPWSDEDATVDLGPASFDGHPAQHYQWKDYILKVVVMSTTDFYADITDRQAAVPLFMSTALTPMGRPVGGTNHTWTDWRRGTPPASKFAVAGVETCKRAKNCGSTAMQLHNLRSRLHHTFARNMNMQIETAAAAAE